MAAPIDQEYMLWLVRAFNDPEMVVMFRKNSDDPLSLISAFRFEDQGSVGGAATSSLHFTSSAGWGHVERCVRESFQVFRIVESQEAQGVESGVAQGLPLGDTRSINQPSVKVKPASWKDYGGYLTLSLHVPHRLLLMNFEMTKSELCFHVQPNELPRPHAYLCIGDAYKIERFSLFISLCYRPRILPSIAEAWEKQDLWAWTSALEAEGIIAPCLIAPFPIDAPEFGSAAVPVSSKRQSNGVSLGEKARSQAFVSSTGKYVQVTGRVNYDQAGVLNKQPPQSGWQPAFPKSSDGAAEQIIDLLGGWSALTAFIEGTPVVTDNGLGFTFNGCQRANCVEIDQVGAGDVYDVSFQQFKPGKGFNIVDRFPLVRQENLKDLFETFTKLEINPAPTT